MAIIGFEELAQLTGKLKLSGKKIVHCHGVFDLLHIGHIRYFKQAREMGDILVVTLTPDRYVDKGHHRPAFTETLRAEAVASLSQVDYVAINRWPTAEETLRLLKPDVYVKGSEFKNTASDFTGKIGKEEVVVNEIGAKLAFTEDIIFSSSNLINKYLSNLPDDINEYLGIFRQRCSLEYLLQLIDKMGQLKVLAIGDTIIDEYQYCEPLGKSNKDPALCVRLNSQDCFAGGILAIANHLSSFTDKVQVATVFGRQNNFEKFARSQINDNVNLHFVMHPKAPTVVKSRFVDGYSFNKLFETYQIDDSGLPPEENDIMCRWLTEKLPEYDLVIVADYGHGAISDEMVEIICRGARFLAVNTQANSGNRGYHTISRYPRADFISIAEHEIRLETRQRNGILRPMMERLAEKMSTSQFVVTCGRKGCQVLDKHGGFVVVPAFAGTVVDRVGAGDTFLSITAMASALGASNEILGFIGNIAGAQAVETIGNKKAIDKLSIKKSITSLMK